MGARPESSDATEIADLPDDASIPAPPSHPSKPERELLTRGSQIGRYLVLGRVGRGGMGEVYAAHDPELDRKIALKLLHGDSEPGNSRARTRMLREAQAMARLVHPNTVTVHDVGEHRGRVFLAMEFVEGETLSAWLAERARSWQEVLPIFLAAGRGLAAAHAAGLIHRDFKPDNVMLAKDGRVLVMDFGLARAELGSPESSVPTVVPTLPADLDATMLAAAIEEAVEVMPAIDDDSTMLGEPLPAPVLGPEELGPDDETHVEPPEQLSQRARVHLSTSALSTSVTQVGALLGTPAYMAPEQLRGLTIDARADQWAFCVALYEALYGRRPFPTKSLADLIGAVLGSPPLPPPPSRSAPGWLHRVIIRGLQRKPEERWPSLDALLLELERRPRRRRRAALLVGAAALAALVGLLAWRSREQPPIPCQGGRDELAEVWNQRSRGAVKRAMLTSELPYAGDTLARVEQELDAWAEAWIVEHREACEATELRREQSSDLLDLRMSCLNERKRSFAALIDALGHADAPLVEHAIERVQELPSVERCSDPSYVRAQVPPPEDRERAAAVEQLRDELATLSQGLSRAGTPDETAAFEHLRTRAEALDYPPLLAEIDAKLGLQLTFAGDIERALELLRRSYFTARRVGADPQAIVAGTALVYTLGNLAARPSDALSFAEHVEAEVARIGSNDDAAGLANAIGLAQHSAGDYEAAERSFTRALALWERELGNKPHIALAAARLNLGRTLRARGQWERARTQLERALAIQTELFGPAHPELGLTLDQLGLVASQVGQLDEAQRRFERALEIRTAALSPTHPSLSHSLGHVGRIAYQRGRYAEALAAWERALGIAEQTQGEAHTDVAAAHSNVGVGLRLLGRYDEARTHYEAALAIYERAIGPEHADTAVAVHNLGNLVALLGEHERALELQERAIATWTDQLGEDHLLVAYGLSGKARALLGLERFADASETAEQALTVLEGSGGKDPKLMVETRNALAAAELGLGRRERARELAEQVLAEIAEQGKDDVGFALERARAYLTWAGSLPAGERKAELLEQARREYTKVPGPALPEAVNL